MANELKYTYGSEVTLEGSGGSCGSGAYVGATSASMASAQHANYPWADFVLKCDFGAAVAPGVSVYLYRQDLNIDSTNDAPAPATTYEATLVGIFQIPSGQSATAYYPCSNVPITKECQFSIKNGTAQNITAGWTLKCTPKSFVPGS